MTKVSQFGPLHRFAALLGHNETVGEWPEAEIYTLTKYE